MYHWFRLGPQPSLSIFVLLDLQGFQMRKIAILICCIAAAFPVAGCSGSNQGTVATTDEDKILAYEKLIDEGEGEDGEEEE